MYLPCRVALSEQLLVQVIGKKWHRRLLDRLNKLTRQESIALLTVLAAAAAFILFIGFLTCPYGSDYLFTRCIRTRPTHVPPLERVESFRPTSSPTALRSSPLQTPVPDEPAALPAGVTVSSIRLTHSELLQPNQELSVGGQQYKIISVQPGGVPGEPVEVQLQPVNPLGKLAIEAVEEQGVAVEFENKAEGGGGEGESFVLWHCAVCLSIGPKRHRMALSFSVRYAHLVSEPRTDSSIWLCIVAELCLVAGAPAPVDEVHEAVEDVLFGVSAEKRATYQAAQESEQWSCMIGGKLVVLPLAKLNDDYCDCDDFSDEPGTDACQVGSVLLLLPSLN